VDQSGLVCFLDAEGIVLDRRRPVEVIRDAWQRVVGTLADGVTGRNTTDFVEEFEWHWRRVQGGVAACSVLNPSEEVEEVLVTINRDRPLWVARRACDIAAFVNTAQPMRGQTLQRALYLPLECGTVIAPPHPDRPFWSVQDVRALLSHVSAANQTRLHQVLKGRARSREYVIVRLPRPSGGATLFGIRFDGVHKHHPLHDEGTARRLIPMYIQRWDHAYLVQRGGGTAALATQGVLLAGCGAVGGHLAFELARAGVGALTLVDHDTLWPENSYRHVLGRRYWGKPKAEALKEELEAQLPYVRVTAVVTTLEAAVADGSVNIAAYDMLLLALGNPTIELAINEHLHALRDGPPAVFTWLEPLGIGGHALLTHNSTGGGCFECLYTSPGDQEVLDNRAAFAAPGQAFGRALSGCGSLHTPYGSVDAVQTAALATRLALAALLGTETGNPLCSWKGAADTFTAAGFRLSPRYEATEAELAHHRYTYQSTGCRICGSAETGKA
jgi:molybdopterin/thiamine biosynthesis adenylyltransferase